MPTPANEFVSHCLELIGSAGPVRAGRMFSGHGIYLDGVFVALVIRDVLYLHTDDQTRAAFEAEGGQPFGFDKRGEHIVTRYWSAPQDAMESPALMRPWARLALASALRAAASKRPAAPRKTAAAPRQASAARPSRRKPAA